MTKEKWKTHFVIDACRKILASSTTPGISSRRVWLFMALLSLAGETETTSKANGIFNDFQLFIEFPASPLFLREKEKNRWLPMMMCWSLIHFFFNVNIVSFWNFGCLLVYTTKSLCDCYCIRSLSSSHTVLLFFCGHCPWQRTSFHSIEELLFCIYLLLGIPRSNDMVGEFRRPVRVRIAPL